MSIEKNPRPIEKHADTATEVVAEVGSTLLILYLAHRISSQNLLKYELTPYQTQDKREQFLADLTKLTEFLEIFSQPLQEINKLKDIYRDIYYKTTTTTKWDGDTLVVETSKEWKESPTLKKLELDHKKIDEWLSFISRIDSNLARQLAQAPNAIDFDFADPVQIKEKIVNPGGRHGLALTLYGGLALAFAFYEEIGDEVADFLDLKLEFKQHQRIKRRSFMKLICTLGIFEFLRRSQKNAVANNDKLLEQIEERLDEAVNSLDVSDEENFLALLGLKPDQIHHEMTEMRDLLQKITESDYKGHILIDRKEWPQLENQIHKTQQSLSIALERLESFFKYNPSTDVFTIPAELSRITGPIRATNHLMDFAKSQYYLLDNMAEINFLIALIGFTISAYTIESFLPLTDEMAREIAKKN